MDGVGGQDEAWVSAERFAAAERYALDLAVHLQRKDAELRAAGAALEAAAERLTHLGAEMPSGDRGSVASPPQLRRGELVLGDLRLDDEAEGMRAASMSITGAADGIGGRLVLRGAAGGPEGGVDTTSTAFLPIAALLATRAFALDLVIEGEVDTQALAGAQAATRLWSSWHGARVPVVWVGERLPPRGGPQVDGLFFSRGLDSMDTLVRRRDRIGHLIGIDWQDGVLATDGTRAVWRGTEEAASAIGMSLLRTSTNARELLDPVMGWGDSFGAVLASVALLMRPVVGRVWISSTFPDRFQVPHGSHPDLDPLWSSADVTICHDWVGDGRVEKAQRVADAPWALAWLKVCWERPGDGNCGRCAKCLMTLTDFELAGRAAAAAGRFDAAVSLDAVRSLVDAPHAGLGNIEDLLWRLDPSSDLFHAWSAVRDALRRSPRTSARGWARGPTR